MQFSLICIPLLLFLSCEVTADSLPQNSVIGCYSLDKNNTKFSFYCSNAEKSFNEICATTTLPEAMQNLNASAVIELKMCGCAIDTLVDVKKQLGNVRTLDISHSHYKNDDLFNHSIAIVDVLFNRKLLKLNAAHNNLKYLPGELFFKMPNLTVIDLSHNQLEDIEFETLIGASELVEIHLQQNGLLFIGRGTFSDTNKLKYLDLRDHSLDGLGCDVLSLLNRPIDIYISWQNISELDIRCIKTELKVRLDEHESIAFRNGIVELHCNQNSFQNLRKISANINQKNNLYEIVSILGQTLRSLKTLALGGGNLVEFDFSIVSQMKQLQELEITFCNLKKVINPSALQSIGLKYFNAFGNQIQNAHEIIDHLNPSIEELFLGKNFVGKLNSTAITRMPNLRYLDLRNTNLQLVDSHYAFDQLKSLYSLDISANNLSKMNFTISFPSKLKYLNVSGCQIENVFDVIQLQGTEIYSLDLSGNFIGTLNGTSFDQLKRLKKLYLKNTSLAFPSDSNPFQKLGLTELVISNNNLKNVNFTILSSTLSKLFSFKAAYCNIESVFDVIKLLGSEIGVLDFSGNVVGKLEESTFDELTNLLGLYLENTSLSFPPDSNPFKRITRLEHLVISHNNLSNVNWPVLSSTLAQLTYLNVAGCQIPNALDLLKLLGPYIGHLDLSGDIVGKVNASTIGRIKASHTLNLSNSSIPNFDFDMLVYANAVEELDISYNRFDKLNISFQMNNLYRLDMRGCELMEIHNFDKFHLPNLKWLGIFMNRLSSETLERLKNEFPSLEFINNDQNSSQEFEENINRLRYRD